MFLRLFQVTYKDREKKKGLYTWSHLTGVRAGEETIREMNTCSPTSMPPSGVDFSPLCDYSGWNVIFLIS